MRDSAWFMRPTFQQKFTRVNIEIYVRKVSCLSGAGNGARKIQQTAKVYAR
jgi:hypothetical protein